MKNRSVVFVLAMFLLVNICQVKQIHASTGHAYELEADTCYQPIIRLDSNDQPVANKQYYEKFDKNVVMVIMRYTNTDTEYFDVFYFSLENFKYNEYAASVITGYACPVDTPSHNSSTKTVDNETIYYYHGNYYAARYTDLTNTGFTQNLSQYNYSQAFNDRWDEAYAIASDMVHGMVDNVDHGSLKVGYNTDFVSSGSGVSGWNKDNISWSVYDSNDNLLDDMNYTIELRAIPGYYKDVSQTQLLLQTVGNFFSGYAMQITNGSLNLEPFEYYTLYRGSPGKKSVSFTWAEVVDKFDMTVDVVNVMSAGDYFYKAGWRYEIRYIYGDLEDPDYVSNWQIIYQVTSVAPQTSEDIYNSVDNGLSPELYNLLQTVNTLNNTVQNWNINGVPIQMDPNQTMQSDGSWIEALINAIASIVGTIGDFFGNILNFFSELLVPSNFEIPDFQEEQQNLIEHTGIFGQSIQMTQSIQQTMESVQEADPVFSFPGFTLNEVELVPSFEVDLNDVVEDLGLEQVHNTELLIMDGIVYLSLFLVVKRKLVEVLKK